MALNGINAIGPSLKIDLIRRNRAVQANAVVEAAESPKKPEVPPHTRQAGELQKATRAVQNKLDPHNRKLLAELERRLPPGTIIDSQV